ncbi:hypothetical protein [Xenorhabdus sp. KJ12.1]|uniref:hypothetical protein n=1 Tax=Xenorhabdus sp. KJ12.1 TaxID=1851571 RepID=UPI000C03EBBD|nr:hypothetical protein [Xenorhabdus sp. KJ12.1]PHM72262.1 hypothetical protein Xekj_00540 [Xenorhabdus sp. KJ12.1]
MNELIEVGNLVFVYQYSDCRGPCIGLDAVAEIRENKGVTLYRMVREDSAWYEADRLRVAERPPAGIDPKFNIGDRVRCYGTYRIYFMTAVVEHIVWFENKADYYVFPTETPWYGYNENSLSLADDSVNTPEWNNMIF